MKIAILGSIVAIAVEALRRVIDCPRENTKLLGFAG